MPLPEGKERGYILPVDAAPSQPVLTAISTDLLNEISEAIPAKHLYFVMDACSGWSAYNFKKTSLFKFHI